MPGEKVLRVYNRDYGRARRLKKLEAGECTWCKNPRERGHSFCAECLEKARARFSARRARGVCSLCENAPREGRTLCSSCAERVSLNAKSKRAAVRAAKEASQSDGTTGTDPA